jgi:hypothetical protein
MIRDYGRGGNTDLPKETHIVNVDYQAVLRITAGVLVVIGIVWAALSHLRRKD